MTASPDTLGIEFGEILVEPEPSDFWHVLPQIGVRKAVGVLHWAADGPGSPWARDGLTGAYAPPAEDAWRSLAGRAQLPWSYETLARYKELVESVGLELAVIEDTPPMEDIQLGRPGREEAIEHFAQFVRAMGRLGIGVLCYAWMPLIGVPRTERDRPGRGSAAMTAFDLAAYQPVYHGPPVEQAALVENLRWFLERIVPVAEEAGVRLAMHPDDPPHSPLGGIARIVSTVEDLWRVVELVDSPANAITLCQGNVALMTDDLPGTIRDFGSAGTIAFAHFRDVVGTPADFVETFVDEGPTDMLACMRAYAEVGFGGVIRTDHAPILHGEDVRVAGGEWWARLHSVGYMQALREAVAAERRAS